MLNGTDNLSSLLSGLDDRRRMALLGFAELLTATAKPDYCGTVGAEVVVHHGDVKQYSLPQKPIMQLPSAACGKSPTLRAV